ncbi:MAG: hypothetical protein R3F65_24325 [bacterium]|nr:hypothetical protein [Myxococcales bacterium]MCB9550726.1 hypothetical protein [Myxococcales bacterium]
MSARGGPTAWAPFALALAALVGCAEGPHAAEDLSCDLRAPVCPAGTDCHLVADGARCLAPVARAADLGCVPGSCAPGEACLAVEGVLGCRPLCDPAGGEPRCPDGQVCGYRVAVDDLGVCPAPCAWPDGCGAEATCGPSPAVPYPICIATGPATLGGSCARERCGAGLGCLTREGEAEPRCEALCPGDGSGSTCGAGSGCTGEVVGVSGVRYCTDG